MKELLQSLLLLLVPAAVLAQETPDAAAPIDEARQYAVEVIIFAYRQLDSVGSEVFVPEPLRPDEGVPSFGDPGTAATPAPVDDEPLSELRYRVLATDELQLRDTARMLSRLQAYEPLMHFGWVQVAAPEAETPPLALERFGTPPDGLDGTLSLKLSRYLHLGVNLTLAAGDVPVPALPDDSGELPTDAVRDHDGTVGYAPLRYELRETRILRIDETRYYDHPHFGVIARITRAEENGSAGAGR